MTASAKRVLSGLLLAGVLLLLALRLGGAETLRETLQQKAANLAALNAPRAAGGTGPVAIAGPAFTTAYTSAALLLAGGAALLAGGALSRRRMGQAALIALILALLGISSSHAANQFNAAVGAADVATALVAGWTLAVLCDDSLLGKTGRQAAIALIVAILAMGAARALMQYFVEYPDLAQYIHDHRDEALRQQGIDPNDTVQTKIFMGRVNSQEVTGFGFYSNVFATEMIGLAGLLAGLLVAGLWLRKTDAPLTEAPARTVKSKGKIELEHAARRPKKREPAQVSVFVLELILLGVLALTAIAVMPMTESKGGTAAGLLGAAAIVLGGIFARRVVARRRVVIGIAVGLTVGLTAAVILYGSVRHGLPTKSLLFRWQYWTASVPIIRDFPAWGTGLNNFGDYYLRFKAPSSPEDVQDPHNFFIRFAAEAGLPAAAAVVALLLWLLRESFGAARSEAGEQTASHRQFAWPAIVAASAGMLAWALLRMLGTTYSDFELIMSFIYGALGVLIFAGVFHLLWHLETAGARIGSVPATRFVAVAAVVAALAMLLYDQVNMALVTGPCAMLFWMLLGVGDSSRPAPAQPRRWPLAAILAGVVSLSAAAAVLFVLTIPVAAGTSRLDPSISEYEYIKEYNQLASDIARRDAAAAKQHAALAQQALDHAIALSPENGELYTQRVVFRRYLASCGLSSLPVAADIRKVLSIDRANARVRLDLALPDSDLPKPERIAALQDALKFDAALPADEPKKLTEAQKAEVQSKIVALQQPAQ